MRQNWRLPWTMLVVSLSAASIAAAIHATSELDVATAATTTARSLRSQCGRARRRGWTELVDGPVRAGDRLVTGVGLRRRSLVSRLVRRYFS